MPKSNSKKSLVIVESPAKAKTINKYLGSDFQVKASMGHVRDLPPKGLNVDIENDFAPTYEISPGKKRTVTSLKAAARDCSDLYLATDLDRAEEKNLPSDFQCHNQNRRNTCLCRTRPN
ncbi:MAG: toprim domain-containing protein [Planctomycetota bacterium]|jgi:DNA topoisomerase-1